MEKSYVTIEKCIICSEDTGNLLLDKRLKNRFDMYTVTGNVCDSCRKKYLSKGVMLLNPENGSLVVIKTSAFKRLFNKKIPKHRIAFTEQAVIDFINKGGE